MNEESLKQLVVVKRSGQRVAFDSPKIAVAIKNAFDSQEERYDEKDINKVYNDVLGYIIENYKNRKTINVEDIQNIIENRLQEDKFNNVYNSFKEYRDKRAKSRQAFSMKQEHKLVKAVEKISNYVFSNEENKYNSGEVITNFGETISEEIVKIYLLDNKYVKAHEEGKIFIHGMKYLSTGMFSSLNLIINEECRKNNLFKLLNLLLNTKKESYGEISLSAIDNLLPPWLITNFKVILKNKISKYLSIKGILNYVCFNKIVDLIDKLNTIDIDEYYFKDFILNEQVSNIFSMAILDSKEEVSNLLVDCLKIILIELNNSNNKYSISFGTSNTYAGKLISNKLLDIVNDLNTLKNVAIIYKIKKNIEQELLGKALEALNKGKNILFSFIDTSYNKNNINDVEYFSNGNRIFENIHSNQKTSNGRMIIATTSINLSQLALKVKDKNKKAFYKELDELLELVKNELISIFDNICNKSKNNYQFLFSNNILDDEKLLENQKIRKSIKNGVLNIGLVGIKECAIGLDKENYLDLSLEIIKYINKKCNKFTKEDKLNFVVSESYDKKALEQLIKLDKTVYGNIEGITNQSIYSTLNKINYSDKIDEELSFFGKIQKVLNGGSILEITIQKKLNMSDFIDLLEKINRNDVGFLKVIMGKSD